MTTVSKIIEEARDKRGLVIIISNDYISNDYTTHREAHNLKPLEGTKEDGRRMKELFSKLHFQTIWEHNISRKGLMDILTQASRYNNYPNHYHCMVFVFSCHGKGDNQLIMQDGKHIHINLEIIMPFLPEQAPLIGKIPKVFLIDACRGEEDLSFTAVARGHGSGVQDKGATALGTLKFPPKGNFLVAYSTVPNYKTFEKKGEGGIWMTTLAHKIEETPGQSVEYILTDVTKELVAKFQEKGWPQNIVIQPDVISRLHDHVILNPLSSHDPLASSVPSGAPYSPLPHQTTPRQDEPRDPPMDTSSPSHLDPPLLASMPEEQARPTNSPMHISESEAQLTDLLKEEGTSPEFDFIEDGSSGQVRHKCTIKITNYGVVERVDGGGYYGSKADAREQASLEALTKERARMMSSRGVHATRIHKERLKAYLAENKQKPKYITKETSKGFESTVFAPGLGYAKGEIGGSRLEAEDNAACAALKRLKVEM